MGRKNRRQEPRPAPTTPGAGGRRYAAQIGLYADSNVVPIRQPGITADWLSELLNGESRQVTSTALGEFGPASTKLHEYAEQAFEPSRTELAEAGMPACSIDPDPWRPATAEPATALDRVMPAVVDVLNGLTRQLEAIREQGPPERADGVTNGEREAWRAALAQAVFVTANASLIASGFSPRRPR